MTNPVLGSADTLITANAIQAEVRDVGLSYTQPTTSVAQSGKMLGNSLGSALHKYLQTEQSNFIEQKQLDAAVRQGEDKAINAVDAEAERTGWKKAIFGQDEGYEVATARAAENSIRDTYIEEASTIDQYSGITPEEYKGRLSEKLTVMLEKNPDNKLYRQAVTDAWAQRAEKLTMRQYEANTAYNQLTARANADRQLRQEFDEIHIDFQNARTPEELGALHNEMKRVLKGENLPSSMHPVAKRKAVNDAAFSSIAQGNIGIYNVMQQTGYVKELDGAERAELDRALGSYTQDWAYDIATKFEEAELAATNAGTNLEVAKETWFKLDEQLNVLKLRSANTPQADSILARYFSASAGKRSMLDELRDKLLKQGAKVDLKADKLAAVQEAIKLPAMMRAGALKDIDSTYGVVTKAEEGDAYDSNLIESIRKSAGLGEEFDNVALSGAVLQNPQLARQVGLSYKNTHIESPLIKRMFENIVGSYANPEFMDEDSKRPTSELVTALSSLRAIAQDDSKLPLSDEKRAEFRMLEAGINAGKTIPTIQETIKSYKENKGKSEAWGLTWPELKNQDNVSKSEFVANLVEKYGGGKPRGATLAKYMETFKDGIVVGGGDFNVAKDYLEDSVKGNTLTYRDKPIQNGKQLNELTGAISFQQTLDWLQTDLTPEGKTQFEEYAKYYLQPEIRDGQPYYPKNLDEVNSWRMKVEDGFDGVFLYINNSTMPWAIHREQLELWSAEANSEAERKEKKAIEARNAAAQAAVMQRYSTYKP